MIDIKQGVNCRIADTVKFIGNGTVILGNNCEIRDYTVIEMDGGILKLGNRCVLGYHNFLQCTGEIILDDCSIVGPSTALISTSHDLTAGQSYLGPLLKGKIHLEKNAWICANVTIGFNTVIGESSIVGANSFVNKSIPAKEIWGGTPAKKIRGI